MWSILNSYLRNNETYRSGICPDSQCKSYIVFTSTDYQVQCVACGQRHQSKNLLNVEDLDSNNGFRVSCLLFNYLYIQLYLLAVMLLTASRIFDELSEIDFELFGRLFYIPIMCVGLVGP